MDRSRAEIHFHILPGVDDGPEELADSVELARAALADGTGTVVATPHVRGDFVTDPLALRELVRNLRVRLAEAGVPLELRLGGELGHDMVGRLRQDELEALAQGPPGARWLLVEAPFAGYDPDFHGSMAELRDRGFGIAIGHPERSADAMDGFAGLRRELAAGALAQVNAMSVVGAHGERVQSAALALVASRDATLVSSDAHGPLRRPALSLAERALLDRGFGSLLARGLTRSAPRRLLARGIPAAAPMAA
jgi:protein-tyrosine phosphatase